jgi:hypothetical protein
MTMLGTSLILMVTMMIFSYGNLGYDTSIRESEFLAHIGASRATLGTKAGKPGPRPWVCGFEKPWPVAGPSQSQAVPNGFGSAWRLRKPKLPQAKPKPGLPGQAGPEQPYSGTRLPPRSLCIYPPPSFNCAAVHCAVPPLCCLPCIVLCPSLVSHSPPPSCCVDVSCRCHSPCHVTLALGTSLSVTPGLIGYRDIQVVLTDLY